MKPPPPPIRFLLAVVGCWVGARALLLWPGWVDQPGDGTPPAAPAAAAEDIAPARPFSGAASQHAAAWVPRTAWAHPMGSNWSSAPTAAPPTLLARQRAFARAAVAAGPVRALAPFSGTPPALTGPIIARADPPLSYPLLLPAIAPQAPQLAPVETRRWSGSAWLFVREPRDQRGLAPGGTLGGSQAGARLAYRINSDPRRPLAVTARLYAPLERPQGAEAALGLDWQPIAQLPLHILAERRERIGREGRSDFAVTVYGGGERRLLDGRLRVEAYGQAGVVGVEQRDLFADGSIRARTPIGPVEVGAGAWGGAQPGVSRLDVGPQASLRIPAGRSGIRASAEWRFRVAGDAQPGSGPTFTLAADF